MKPNLLMLFLRWCPGALGIMLRQKLYPKLLGNCGKNVLIGRYVTFSNPEKIHLGDNVIINDLASLFVSNSTPQAAIVLEKGAFLGTGSRLIAENDRISLLSGCNIGSNCLIFAQKEVRIEENVLFAAYCKVGDPSLLTSNQQDEKGQTTVIGAGSWLGVRTVVNEGVHIGHDSIVGAHSTVDADIEPYIIAFGQPARRRVHRLEEKEKSKLYQEIRK